MAWCICFVKVEIGHKCEECCENVTVTPNGYLSQKLCCDVQLLGSFKAHSSYSSRPSQYSSISRVSQLSRKCKKNCGLYEKGPADGHVALRWASSAPPPVEIVLQSTKPPLLGFRLAHLFSSLPSSSFFSHLYPLKQAQCNFGILEKAPADGHVALIKVA